jgi:putative addiction module component (TIGR02574 family)
MPDVVTELAERGRALAPEERARLVDLLLDSLHESPEPEVEQAWRLEIRRRVEAYKRGEVKLHDADDVLAEVKRIAP